MYISFGISHIIIGIIYVLCRMYKLNTTRKSKHFTKRFPLAIFKKKTLAISASKIWNHQKNARRFKILRILNENQKRRFHKTGQPNEGEKDDDNTNNNNEDGKETITIIYDFAGIILISE